MHTNDERIFDTRTILHVPNMPPNRVISTTIIRNCPCKNHWILDNTIISQCQYHSRFEVVLHRALDVFYVNHDHEARFDCIERRRLALDTHTHTNKNNSLASSCCTRTPSLTEILSMVSWYHTCTPEYRTEAQIVNYWKKTCVCK